MPFSSERHFQDAVVALAEAAGWRVHYVAFSGRSPAGFPDLCLASAAQRRVIFRELKTERGRLMPAQRR